MLLAARDRADFGEDDPIGFTGDELRGWAMDEPGLATDAWIALRGDEIVGPEAPAGTMIWDYRPGDEDAELTRCTRRLSQGTGSSRRARSTSCFGKDRFGWVLDLAVRPTSQRAALGLVSLQSGFVALWRRGHTRVGLEVDSENETGATRIYERAGMRVTRRYATYEKVLA